MTAWYRGLSALALVGALHLVVAPPARADVVLDWNEIAVNTAIANNQNPFSQARTAAIVQLAVFEAVNAVTGGYERYIDTRIVPEGASGADASAEAAAIAAAHTALKRLFPGSAASLDAARQTSLASIPDGPAETLGTDIGDAAGNALVDLRANDGSVATPPSAAFYEPGAPSPGGWQTTPGCPINTATGLRRGILFHWRTVTPFGIASAAEFMPGPPPAMTSGTYAKDYNEVKRVGSLNSPDRPQDRTDVARFYASASPTAVFSSAARQIAGTQGDSLAENARALALLAMAINDALIASFAAKYEYLLWRPEHAIPAGDTDGNDRTDAAPFAPLIVTPCFPSYPSNHASGSGAGAELLRRLYGGGGHDVTLTNPNVPTVLHYTTFNQITDDVDDARVYGGIHFRFDQEAGNKLGRDVATEVYKNNLRPTHGH